MCDTEEYATIRFRLVCPRQTIEPHTKDTKPIIMIKS